MDLRRDGITASEISYFPGILESTGKGATSMGIGLPGDRKWAYSSTRSYVRVSRNTRAGGGGLFTASLYHPSIQTQASLTRGGIRCEEVVSSAACLLHLSLLIRAEALTDLSDELLDGPLGPFLARSDPSVHGCPRLIRNPSRNHPLT